MNVVTITGKEIVSFSLPAVVCACNEHSYACTAAWRFAIHTGMNVCKHTAQVYLQEQPVIMTDLWKEDEAAVIVLSRSMG